VTDSATAKRATAAPVTGRAPRRDALENRDRLVLAASTVFGEYGTEASLELVAREADLGLATLFRRFPNKDALVTEVVNAILRHIVAVARGEAQATDGQGFERWLWAYADIQSRKRGLVAHFWADNAETAPLRAELMEALGELLDRAKARRRVRDEIEISDVVLVIFALRGIAESVRYEESKSWRRHVSLVLAGLRPARSSLGAPPWPLGTVDPRPAAGGRRTALRTVK
jgi:AcrR family transcriptional regulator